MKNYNSKVEKLNASALNQLSSLSEKSKETSQKELTFQFKNKDLKIPKIGSDSFHLRQFDVDNTVKLEIDVNTNGGMYYREKIDDLFYYGEVYSNGSMRSKGISSWLGFSINKGYKYDEKGKLIETIDYDEGYEFNYEKVLEFCKKNNIHLQLNIMNRLNKTILESKRKVWNIDYFNPDTNKIDFYQLDGHKGEIIKKELGKEKYGIRHYEMPKK